MDHAEKVVLSIFIGLICLCLLVGILCGGSIFIKQILPALKNPTISIPFFATQTQTYSTPIIISTDVPDLPRAEETLEILKNTAIPSADWVDLAEKFNGKIDIPRTLDTPPVDYQVGDTLYFWTQNVDTNVNKEILAYLAYETKDVYFWVEQGIYPNEQELKTLVNKFAKQIYPTDQEFFGKEWIPGVDNDPHLYVLYATDLGSTVAGYTSSTDSVLPEAHEFANAHEMFSINADIQSITDDYTLSVMAHELQHLIHGYHDPNEETWLNEGFSELAVFLNGYNPGGFDYLFSYDPDIQLNEWPNDASATEAHYGSGFLFTTYLLDRFGEDTTKAVVAGQKNGMDSIDEVFNQEGLIDPLSDKPMSADQLFMDWTVANFLNDSSIQDSRFYYHNYQNVPYFSNTEVINECNSGVQNRTVNQYGTDYIQIYCKADFNLTFNGASTVNILPISSTDGSVFVWSNKADVSDMTMTQQFDFTGVTGEIDMIYSMWYDLETDYDFVYLLSSSDGETWEMIDTPTCTTGNVSGNNFGCGYNDVTNGWRQETVDLSEFAGQKILLRFEYVTDTAVTGEGFAIDSISIPQTGYYTNFENDNGGWELQGFVRISNQIPQTFLVSLIHTIDSEKIVTQYEVTPGDTISFEVDDRSSYEGSVLVVSGSARYTRQKGNYQFELSK